MASHLCHNSVYYQAFGHSRSQIPAAGTKSITTALAAANLFNESEFCVIPAYAGIQNYSRANGNPDRSIMAGQFYVYILASGRNGTLYTGMTSNLVQRVWQHKKDLIEGFTSKYGVKMLVYYEVHDDPERAIRREKQIKKWRRMWKLQLIESRNPNWKDLYELIVY